MHFQSPHFSSQCVVWCVFQVFQSAQVFAIDWFQRLWEELHIFLCVTKSPCHGLQSYLQWFTIDSHFNFSCYFLSSHRCLFWLTGNFIIHRMHWVSPYTWFVVISLCLLNANFRTQLDRNGRLSRDNKMSLFNKRQHWKNVCESTKIKYLWLWPILID